MSSSWDRPDDDSDWADVAPGPTDAPTGEEERAPQGRSGDKGVRREPAGLDEVLDTEESVHPTRREHAKAPPRPDGDELAERADHELAEVERDDEARRRTKS